MNLLDSRFRGNDKNGEIAIFTSPSTFILGENGVLKCFEKDQITTVVEGFMPEDQIRKVGFNSLSMATRAYTTDFFKRLNGYELM